MRELRIDFENVRGPFRAGWVAPLLGAALVLAAVVVGAYRDARASHEYWNGEVVRLQRAGAHGTQRAAAPDSTDPAGTSELKRAREIVGQLALPWDPLFRALETATPSSVALLAIEPNPQKRSVRLSGEGKDIYAVLAYVQQLEQQPVLHDVYLLDHGTTEADAQRPARFVIEAGWSGANHE